MSPTSAELPDEKRGKVYIHDNIYAHEGYEALDKHFDRDQLMMCTCVRQAPKSVRALQSRKTVAPVRTLPFDRQGWNVVQR